MFLLFWEGDRILFSILKEEVNEFLSEAEEGGVNIEMTGVRQPLGGQTALVWVKFKY